MVYLKLFIEFFKTGLLAVGGGMATVPFLLKIGEKTSWFTAVDLADMIAVSESTPGPIGVNMSTYVGYSVAGFPGALVSTLSLVLPSFLVIILVSTFLNKFHENMIVKTVFVFLRAVAVGMLAYALYSVLRLSLFDNNKLSIIKSSGFVLFTFFVFYFKKIHPVLWILIGAVLGILFL